IGVLALALGLILGICFMERAQRRVLIQYPKRQTARGQMQAERSHLPLKINTAGVIPPIFASSLLLLPTTVASFSQASGGTGFLSTMATYLAHGRPAFMILYAALIIFFCFFYTSITFNPDEVADNMKKYGGFVPGIRAGRPTAEYLDYVITRITAAGSVYLAIVALIPTIVLVVLGVSTNIPFGGTSILIIVGVGLETVKQIDSQLQQRHYEGFLR
ncbi:MAG: preprotein translocase subunit SecY, partial [Actinomycetes bacterium]